MEVLRMTARVYARSHAAEPSRLLPAWLCLLPLNSAPCSALSWVKPGGLAVKLSGLPQQAFQAPACSQIVLF